MTTMNKHAVLLWVFLAGLAPLAGFGDELGDPAPALTVKEWIKGSPVEIKPGTNVYVVEIFGTTGPTVRASFAKLNEIQKKYKDKGVIVVGVSDETPEKIRKFVELPDVQIDFAIGADTARRTSMDYMLGFKLRTIPQVFVVGKDAKLLWHGDPLHGLDQVLTKVLAGTYQVERAKDTDTFRRQVEAYQSFSRKGDPRARAAGESLIAGWTNSMSRLRDFAYVIITDTQNPHRDLPLAGQALDMAERLSPTNKLSLFTARAAYMFETGKQDEAIAMTKDAIAAAKDPKEKAALEPYLRALETRKAKLAAKANAPATTNIVTITNVITVTNTITVTNGPRADAGKRGSPAGSERSGSSAP
jgi:peroxiredoxin